MALNHKTCTTTIPKYGAKSHVLLIFVALTPCLWGKTHTHTGGPLLGCSRLQFWGGLIARLTDSLHLTKKRYANGTITKVSTIPGISWLAIQVSVFDFFLRWHTDELPTLQRPTRDTVAASNTPNFSVAEALVPLQSKEGTLARKMTEARKMGNNGYK